MLLNTQLYFNTHPQYSDPSLSVVHWFQDLLWYLDIQVPIWPCMVFRFISALDTTALETAQTLCDQLSHSNF